MTSSDSFPWEPLIYQESVTLKLYPPIPDSIIVNVWLNNVFYKTLQHDSVLQFPIDLLKPGSNTCKIIAMLPTGSTHLFDKTFEINRPAFRQLDYSRLSGKTKKIALTFDAGSQDTAIDSIISILEKYNIPATAFLTGEFITKFPARVQQLVNSGHFIFGNHSFSHPHLTSYASNNKHLTLPTVSFKFIQKQLQKTDSIFFNQVGSHLLKIWRAPYGEYNKEILNWAGHLGYAHIGWSYGFDTFDWVVDSTSSIYYTPEQMWQKWHTRFLKESKRFNGAIILMHLGNERAVPMYKFLHHFIPFMKQKGYTFVNLSKLDQK